MLRLWGAERSGPYFTALHFFFGIGNAAGPILAEVFLGGDDDVEKRDSERGKNIFKTIETGYYKAFLDPGYMGKLHFMQIQQNQVIYNKINPNLRYDYSLTDFTLCTSRYVGDSYCIRSIYTDLPDTESKTSDNTIWHQQPQYRLGNE